MTTAPATAVTTDQIDRLALCFRTLGWPRDQVTRFLLAGWQVERLSHLTGAGADAAIAALVAALAVWATPEDDPAAPGADALAGPTQSSVLPTQSSDNPDWDGLVSVDRPDAPALLTQRTQIEVLLEQLHWHPQHRANHLRKHYAVDTVRQLTVAQAEAAITDLTTRLDFLPVGVAP